MLFNVNKNLVLALALSTQSVCAGTMGAESVPYDGLYVGGNIGISNIANSTSTTYPLAAHHMSSSGLIGGGLVGYDYSVNEKIKFGLEGFGNATGVNTSALQLYAPSASYRVGQGYNAGFRVLPGYQLPSGETVAHLLLGYTNAGFNVKDNGDYGYINKNLNQSGFQAGLGMKTRFTKNLSIRADALYSIYANASNTGISNLAPYGAQIYNNNLSTLEGDLTLLYKFN